MRGLTLTFSLVALALAASGCNALFPSRHQSDDDLRKNTEIAGQLARTWSALPDVTQVDAEYIDDTDRVSNMRADVRCDGCDEEKLADRLVDDIWSSELSPLVNITVQVFDDAGSSKSALRVFSTHSDADELNQKHGERPAGTELE